MHKCINAFVVYLVICGAGVFATFIYYYFFFFIVVMQHTTKKTQKESQKELEDNHSSHI